MKTLKQVLMERDGLTEDEALDLIEEAAVEVEDGVDPEEVLSNNFGLEPDWVMDLLDYII